MTEITPLYLLVDYLACYGPADMRDAADYIEEQYPMSSALAFEWLHDGRHALKSSHIATIEYNGNSEWVMALGPVGQKLSASRREPQGSSAPAPARDPGAGASGRPTRTYWFLTIHTHACSFQNYYIAVDGPIFRHSDILKEFGAGAAITFFKQLTEKEWMTSNT